MSEELVQQMLSRGWSVEFVCEPGIPGMSDAALFSSLVFLAAIETAILSCRNVHYQELLTDFLGE